MNQQSEAAAATPAATDSATAEPPSELQEVRRRGRMRGSLALLGPAFVAAIAYIDPGNFGTNIDGGARYGYALIWVVVLANLMAMMVQYLSAKVGIATGHNLSELCRLRFSKRTTFGLWIQAEFIAIATDLAEFAGAAIALNLLFGVPLFVAGCITAVIAFAILGLRRRGHRRFELAIIAFLAIVFAGFAYDLIAVGMAGAEFAKGLIPSIENRGALVLAVGIVGATVMPHVVYLHSALTQRRISPINDSERRELLRFQRTDVTVAMSIAGAVNIAMMVIAAELLFGTPSTTGDSISDLYSSLGTYVGGGAALAFAVALLSSGLSSASVGTYAGQVVMQGFINRRIPLFVRRAITMTPALILLAIEVNPTEIIVISQIVLSFGIPFALIPLIMLTRNREVMSALVNRRATTTIAVVIATIVIALNVVLLVEALG
jgi:manganese transport protein